MPYVRVSFMRALEGREREVRSLIDRFVLYDGTQPGNLGGYRLEHADGAEQFGRIGIWQSKVDAERAAQTAHDMALCSELNAVIDEASHHEYSFEGTPTTVRQDTFGLRVSPAGPPSARGARAVRSR